MPVVRSHTSAQLADHRRRFDAINDRRRAQRVPMDEACSWRGPGGEQALWLLDVSVTGALVVAEPIGVATVGDEVVLRLAGTDVRAVVRRRVAHPHPLLNAYGIELLDRIPESTAREITRRRAGPPPLSSAG